MLDASVSQRTGWRIFSCRCHTQLPANRVSVCGTDCERGQPNYPLLCCASKPPACIATPAGVVCKKIIKRVSILDPEGANFFFFFFKSWPRLYWFSPSSSSNRSRPCCPCLYLQYQTGHAPFFVFEVQIEFHVIQSTYFYSAWPKEVADRFPRMEPFFLYSPTVLLFEHFTVMPPLHYYFHLSALIVTINRQPGFFCVAFSLRLNLNSGLINAGRLSAEEQGSEALNALITVIFYLDLLHQKTGKGRCMNGSVSVETLETPIDWLVSSYLFYASSFLIQCFCFY